MDNTIKEDEILYRMVKRSQPDTIDCHGRPTSALFKQDDGVSVDRDGKRLEDDIINTFKERFGIRFKGLVKVGAKICQENDISVIPAPTENIYHAEIFENAEKAPLGQLKALILADSAEVVILDASVKWTK